MYLYMYINKHAHTHPLYMYVLNVHWRILENDQHSSKISISAISSH